MAIIVATLVPPCASSAMSSKTWKRKCPRSVARNDAGSRMLLTISKAKILRNGSRADFRFSILIFGGHITSRRRCWKWAEK